MKSKGNYGAIDYPPILVLVFFIRCARELRVSSLFIAIWGAAVLTVDDPVLTALETLFLRIATAPPLGVEKLSACFLADIAVFLFVIVAIIITILLDY